MQQTSNSLKAFLDQLIQNGSLKESHKQGIISFVETLSLFEVREEVTVEEIMTASDHMGAALDHISSQVQANSLKEQSRFEQQIIDYVSLLGLMMHYGDRVYGLIDPEKSRDHMTLKQSVGQALIGQMGGLIGVYHNFLNTDPEHDFLRLAMSNPGQPLSVYDRPERESNISRTALEVLSLVAASGSGELGSFLRRHLETLQEAEKLIGSPLSQMGDTVISMNALKEVVDKLCDPGMTRKAQNPESQVHKTVAAYGLACSMAAKALHDQRGRS